MSGSIITDCEGQDEEESMRGKGWEGEDVKEG